MIRTPLGEQRNALGTLGYSPVTLMHLGPNRAIQDAERPFTGVPEELKELRRWVTWRYETRNDKRTKRPLQSIARRREWLSFSDACSRLACDVGDGIGFILGDGVVGIDLDDCISSDGTLHEIARDAIETLGTYVERSPSNRGLHFFIRAEITRSRKIGKEAGRPGREVYDGSKGSARYFTVTGNRVGSAKRLASGRQAQAALDTFHAKWFADERAVENDLARRADSRSDDDQVLSIMFGAKDGAKWRAIYDGDHSRYQSQSEADLALCGKLRFYSRADTAQIDRLFRRSGLMRKKWDERHGAKTYGASTIEKALAKGGPIYHPPYNDTGARDTKERSTYGKVRLWWIVRVGGAGECALRVLAVIACYADAKGEAFPSVATVAAHLRVSERYVKTALKKLKELGVLTSTPRARQSNLYRLASTVPENITPYAMERAPRRVKESGHLECCSRGTVTNQEQTIVNTREGEAEKSDRAKIKSVATHATGPCHWPATLPVCDFLIGRSGEVCERCGGSWIEHFEV